MAIWGLVFILAVLLMVEWGAGTGVHNDFTQNVWLPSRLLLDGANPYNPTREQVNAALGAYSSEFTLFNSGLNFHAIYPIWVSLVFTPFAALPLTTALALWRAANLLLLLWGVTRLLSVSNPAFRELRVGSVSAVIVTLIVALIYRESIVTLFSGQFSIIEFGILAGIWGYLVTPRQAAGSGLLLGDVALGVGLGVLATKPQSVGLAVLLLCLWALSRKRWIIPVAAVVSACGLLVMPLVAYPGSIGDWLNIVLRGQASSQAEVSASVWGLSYQWLHTFMPWVPVAAALTLLGMAVLVPPWLRDIADGRSTVPLALPLTLAVNSVVSPYLLGYEQVVLLVPAIIFLAAAGLPADQSDPRSRRWRLILYGWIAVLPFLIVVIQTFEDLEYPLIIQSVTMLLLCWAADCGLRISEHAPASRFVLRTPGAEPAMPGRLGFSHFRQSASGRGQGW